jgi:hypothetical protein
MIVIYQGKYMETIKKAIEHCYSDPLGAPQFSIYFINYMLIEKIGVSRAMWGVLIIMMISGVLIPGCAPLA